MAKVYDRKNFKALTVGEYNIIVEDNDPLYNILKKYECAMSIQRDIAHAYALGAVEGVGELFNS